MKRLLWLGAGLAIGALVVRAVGKRAQAYTPGGVAAAARQSGASLLDSVRDFVDDVRDGMHEREQELHAAFAEGVAIEELVDAELDGAGAADGPTALGPDPTGQRAGHTYPEDAGR